LHICVKFSSCLQQCKNYRNRSRFSKVMITNVGLLPPFYSSRCRSGLLSMWTDSLDSNMTNLPLPLDVQTLKAFQLQGFCRHARGPSGGCAPDPVVQGCPTAGPRAASGPRPLIIRPATILQRTLFTDLCFLSFSVCL